MTGNDALNMLVDIWLDGFTSGRRQWRQGFYRSSRRWRCRMTTRDRLRWLLLVGAVAGSWGAIGLLLGTAVGR